MTFNTLIIILALRCTCLFIIMYVFYVALGLWLGLAVYGVLSFIWGICDLMQSAPHDELRAEEIEHG
jgi:hypothetical protein